MTLRALIESELHHGVILEFVVELGSFLCHPLMLVQALNLGTIQGSLLNHVSHSNSLLNNSQEIFGEVLFSSHEGVA